MLQQDLQIKLDNKPTHSVSDYVSSMIKSSVRLNSYVKIRAKTGLFYTYYIKRLIIKKV